MKVLIVGGGGREHALAWSLSKSSSVSSIMAAPGNPGIAQHADLHPVGATDVDGLEQLALQTQPDLVVVGPEAPLVAGLADRLRARGLRVFGPGAAGARIEGSKSFAKDLMERHQIPTAQARSFSDISAAKSYVRQLGGQVVIKADGLAAGKGVTVCETVQAADAALHECMVSRRFGDAGDVVLVEELMVGEELSVIAFTDGKSVVAMPPAQDFKRLYDEDRGPNTGGMGSYSPVPACTPEILEEALTRIIEPAVAALAEDGEPYVGALYAGLMLTESGAKVVEFNCRFGDPETQALLPRLDSDLAEVMLASVEGGLSGVELRWSQDPCVCVVAASDGYPAADPVPSGYPILGLDAASAVTGIPVFHAGTAMKAGRLVTAGGRVLAISATGNNVAVARERAYQGLAQVSFDGMRFRKDIATRGI